MEPAFKEYWNTNRDRLLREDPEYDEALKSYGMKSGADWILFGIPVVAGIVAMQMLPVQHELLRFALSVVITIVAFVISVFVKSATSPHRALSDIENDIRERVYSEWKKEKLNTKQKKR